jgi:putative endonuclease
MEMRIVNRKQRVGKWGENLARDYLEKKGCEFIASNVRTGYGELDLIFATKEGILFVEVKTRTNSEFGLPEDAVYGTKKIHLLQASEAYMQIHPELGGTWRIDVISIQGSPEKPDDIQIEWFENVIE